MCVWGDVRTWVASCTHSCFWGSYVPGKLGLISQGGGKGAMQSSRIWNHSAKGRSGPCSSSLSSLPPGLGLWVPGGPEEYTASGGSCVPPPPRPGHPWSGQELSHAADGRGGAQHMASFLIQALPWAGVPPPPEQQMASGVLGREQSRAGRG